MEGTTRKPHILGNLLLIIAAFSMLISLGYESVTVANGDYRGVLTKALVAMTMADLLCASQFSRQGRARWIAIFIALPSLFVLWDFAKRAPHVWK